MEPLQREGDIAWCPKHHAIGAILGGKFITATAEYQFAKDDIHIEACCDWQPLVPVEQVAALRAENERLREALESALHDLVTSDGLYACDNEAGHSLFRLEQKSIAAARAALEGEQ